MLFISNEDVEKVLTIEDTLRVLERGHRELARGELVSRPRVDIYTETHAKDKFHRWGTMEGSRLLYVSSEEELGFWLKVWEERQQAFKYCGLEREILSFEDKMPFFFTHLDHPGMPRTTNIIEGIIRQLSRKIDDTDGFESTETAWRSIQLLIMRYRFHRFTDSRLEGHNGKAPLELAGVNIEGIDWVHFSKNSTTNGTRYQKLHTWGRQDALLEEKSGGRSPPRYSRARQ